MSELAIEVASLVKKYYGEGLSAKNSRQEKLALNNMDLKVPKGSVFGLLGPNGAGKSTLINILAGTVTKSSGTAKIMGVDIDEQPKDSRRKIGIVPQEIVVDSFFPLYQALEFYAGYYGIRPKDRKTTKILKSVGLYDKRNNKPPQLSGGMKRRFLVAKAMVHNPEVIILDEPTAGVDIELRDQLWNFIRELNAEGKTIILTTHYLAEAQALCDRIAFINNGRIVKEDSKDNLLKNLGSRFLDIEFEDDVASDSIKKIYKKFELLNDKHVRFHIDVEKNNFDEILGAVQSNGLKIKDLRIIQPDLEDIFYKIIKA